jgi:hypothetical protein
MEKKATIKSSRIQAASAQAKVIGAGEDPVQ